LRVLADLGVDEVAAIMGRTANWVRVTQHRALRRLASRLGPKLDVMR
jgi:DNA-directed RNA polymerase specialized sigma24 family protein